MRNFSKLFLILLISVNASAQQTNPADSIYNIQDSVLIKTRDGALIFVIIVQKKKNTQPLPAILFYTTYFQGSGDAILAKRSADRDYVGVVAYSRGIRTNLKDYAPYENDGNDVYDVIDWISKQTWCNGKVGMYGGSYTGFVQWSATKATHPALKTIVPQVAVMPGYDSPMENNIPFQSILIWSHDNIYKYKPLSNDLDSIWYTKGTSFRSKDSLAGYYNPIFQKWLQHPGYDNYWKSLSPSPQEYADIEIPILAMTGYYDGAQIGAFQYVKQYFKYNKNPDLYFVIGPYNHFGGQRKPPSNLMGYEIDTVANIDMRELAFQWLDHILKNAEKPKILVDRINYEVMGANEWKHVSSIGKMNNDTLSFYLSDNKIGYHYLLATTKPTNMNYLNQTVDFKDRTSQNNYYTPLIINDSLDTSNGLLFATEPFNKTFSINGCFLGNLVTSINKMDMDVSVVLYEQLPNGKYFYLARYLGRASYAKDNSTRQLLKPNKVESILFDNTRLVSKQISEGSRLVIILNVNKHPFEEINYGTGKDVHDETIQDAKEPLQIKWYNDSYIKVPIWK